MAKISVLDFGGQYAHLIASRLRSLGFCAEVQLPQDPNLNLEDTRGIILSGGPASVLAPEAPQLDPAILDLGKPILAICYGFQLVVKMRGGKIRKGQVAEFGPAQITQQTPSKILAQLPKTSEVWMSHFDEVTSLPAQWQTFASTKNCHFAAAGTENFFGVQFHPEVLHTKYGRRILANFGQLCQLPQNWNLTKFLATEIKHLKKQVGPKKVFLLVSGGVDSTVAFALLNKALGPQKVFGLLIETGLLRTQEAQNIQQTLRKNGFQNLFVENASGHFLAALKQATEPEKKRQIIGRVFLRTQQKVLKRLKFNPRNWLLGQGTIYPDTIESAGTQNAARIKTHHNRVPEIEKMLAQNLVVEPLAKLYKNEVREIGKALKLPASLIQREPFPGPGLGIRILCGQKQDCPTKNQLQMAIKQKWQISSKILPVRSVGVQGDARTFGHPVALFTRNWNLKKLTVIATEITNKFPALNRVLLCLTTKTAPRHLLHKAMFLTKQRVELCRKADSLARAILQKAGEKHKVWQMPVVLVPVSTDNKRESLVLRPVESQEAMTASATQFPPKLLSAFTQQLSKIPEIEQIFLDLTNKPPATIEWE